ncbi:hypothetical protein P3L10_010872 [Capsicum annuum]
MSVLRGHPRLFQPSDWKENRLSFHFNLDLSQDTLVGLETGKSFDQELRSVISSGITYLGWNAFLQISKLRLLGVLDLSSFTMHYLCSAIFNQLIHLKYLAVQTGVIDFHPETLLFNLQTLIVCGLELDIVLPATFWKMVMLRRFDIDRVELDFHYLEDGKQQIIEESSKLENLKFLSRVRLSPQDAHDWVDVLSRRCPNLEEFCICIRPSGGRTCNLELQGFTQLQTLEISSYAVLPGFQLPSTLKNLDISTGDASEESFPQLEILVISWCWKLKEVPPSFADILTLKQIKLIQCKNESLEASTLQIKEEIKANEGSDRLKIINKLQRGIFTALKSLLMHFTFRKVDSPAALSTGIILPFNAFSSVWASTLIKLWESIVEPVQFLRGVNEKRIEIKGKCAC